MKLELVMLATVFSVITERQVEAQLECYRDRSLTGVKVILHTNQDVRSQFPDGPGACKVPANTTVIFYSQPNFLGDVNTFSYEGKKIYIRRSRFKVGSILILGNADKEGLFLFKQQNFNGGSFQKFSGEDENVAGNITFGSAIVMGKFWYWTVTRRCHLTDCQRKCPVCLQGDKSGVSFIKNIDSTDMWQTLAVTPGACVGTNYTGESVIPGKGLQCYSCHSDLDYSCQTGNSSHFPFSDISIDSGRKCKTCILKFGKRRSGEYYTIRYCRPFKFFYSSTCHTNHHGVTECYCYSDFCNENKNTAV